MPRRRIARGHSPEARSLPANESFTKLARPFSDGVVGVSRFSSYLPFCSGEWPLPRGGGAAWGGLFLLGITAIPIIYWVLVWRATAYALTDRRVLLVTGIRQSTFQDATYAQVQSLNLVSGWGGGLKFDATPPSAPHTLIGTRKFSKKIFWRALRDPSRVQSFIQEAFLLHEREAAQTGLRDALIAKMTENRFPCAYCRTLIDIRTVDFATARCPSCGAPLAIPE
jgi:hypothetical protein